MTVIDQSAGMQRVSGIDEMRDYYRGSQGDDVKLGAEVEFTIARQNDLCVPDWLQTQNLYNSLFQDDFLTGYEPPTSAIEVATAPYAQVELDGAFREINKGTRALFEKSDVLGLALSPFGHLPHIEFKDIQVVDTVRYQSFFAPPRDDMIEVARFFTQCMNIQVSVGYKDPDHLLKIIRLATALEPVICLTFDSSCGYDQGRKIDHIQNIAQKNKMGINTGIPDFYYTAKNGTEFIEDHIRFSMQHKHMFTAFDESGHLKRLPSGVFTCFNDLEKIGFAQQSLMNYLQGQSQSWRRACNVATIMDSRGALVNHRAELCAFQNGLLHQRTSALLMTYLIGFDPEFYEDIQKTLLDFGMDLDNLAGSKAMLEHNFKAACYHGNRYNEVDFGTGSIGEFAKQFAVHIEKAISRASVLEAYADPLIHILRHGRPDWLVYREKMPDLEACMDYLRSFTSRAKDDERFISHEYCADQLL